MAESVFVADAAGFERAFRSWNGTLGQWLNKKTILATTYARDAAPGPTGRPNNRTGINYGTGQLRREIVSARSRWKTELEGQVIAVPKHALMVHEGTRPHTILPKSSPVLSFKWAKAGGKRVYFKRVNHPGTRRNPYLVVGLRRAIRG